jgi:hypothetical protein
VLTEADLLESFLLPSLISALRWAGDAYRHDSIVVGKLLEVLTKPPGATESQDIHQTILAMCAPRLKLRLRMNDTATIEPILKVFDKCQAFTLEAERGLPDDGNENGISMLQHSLITLITSTEAPSPQLQMEFRDISALISRAVEARGPDATLRTLITVLLQLSNGHQFLFALDAITTAICVADQRLQDALRLQYHNISSWLKIGDTLSAEAVVRLYRQVEAYKTLLTVQQMELNPIFAQQLSNIDTANPDLDGITAVSGAEEVQVDLGQPDAIDQALNEVAAMGDLEPGDGSVNFDDFYGLQGNDMDLNDLDLDNMF